MRRHTMVKVRELTPGMVVRVLAGFGPQRTMSELPVMRVERAADAFDRLRGEVAAAKSRVAAADAAREMLHAFEGLTCEGREARLVHFGGLGKPRAFASGEELRYVGHTSITAPS